MKGRQAGLFAVGGVAFLFGAWLALKGMFASEEQLLTMADKIGTKNPVLARAVCWIGFLPLLLGGVGLLVLAVMMVYGSVG
jgi:hypothetical protein